MSPGLLCFLCLGLVVVIVSVPAQAAPKLALNSLSPSSATAGGGGFTLTVNGSGFNGKCVVLWNGQALATTVLSGSSASAAVPSADVANAGSDSISVQNSRTGATSNSLTFTVTAATAAAAAPVAVRVSPGAVSLAGGASQQFTASVTGSTNTGVSWTTSGGAITAGGLYVAPSTTGTYTVTATSAADTTKSASATIAVNVPVSVAVSPTAPSLVTGGTQQFTATVSGTTNTGVTWKASGGSVTPGGLYTAPATAGTYTVTATSMADTTKSASASVAVSAPHAAQLLWIASPSSGVVGYNIYRSTVSGSGYALLNSAPDASLSYTDSTVQAGQTYYYVVTAVTSGGAQSSDSTQVTAVIP